MARPDDIPDALRNLAGLKILGRIQPLFAHLHDHACRRDKAGNNRTLHLDQLAILVLLAMFNPIARSLRALSQVSDLDQVRKRFGLEHASLGSLSEAARLFDPEALQTVIAELAGDLRGVQNDPRLAALKNPLTAVDGTLLKALPRMVESAWVSTKDGRTLHAWRLHLHFDVDRSVPARVELTGPSNSGESDEKAVLRKSVEAGRTYVMDRWFGQFTLFNASQRRAAATSAGSATTATSSRRGPPAPPRRRRRGRLRLDREAGDWRRPPRSRPDHRHALVVIRTTPHEKRGGRKGGRPGRRATAMLRIGDEPAGRAGGDHRDIYKYRWTIEIFFRFFKHVLGCRHLSEQHPRGSCAGVLRDHRLPADQLETGRKPTRRTYEMLCYYFLGLASLKEMTAHLAKVEAREAAKSKA